MSNSPEHDQYLEPVERFLTFNWHYWTIMEPALRKGQTGEVPDLYGWRRLDNDTIVVDIKHRVEDTHAHAGKEHVRNPHLGVGVYRYLAMPKALLRERITVPDYWGVLVIDTDGGIYISSQAQRWPNHARNIWAEADMIAHRFERHLKDGRSPTKPNGAHTKTSTLTESDQQTLRNALANWGATYVKYLAPLLATPRRKEQRVRNEILADARNGTLSGMVVVEDNPMKLALAEHEEEVAV